MKFRQSYKMLPGRNLKYATLVKWSVTKKIYEEKNANFLREIFFLLPSRAFTRDTSSHVTRHTF